MRSKSTASMQKLVAMRNNPGATRRKEGKLRETKLSRSIKKVRAEMVEIREGQKLIKEGQRVKKRKNREHKKWAKKAEIKQQKAGFCDAQNKIITEQETRVGELLKEPLVQDLLARSNQLELAQGAMLSPNANSDARVPSEDAIIELKHRTEMLSKVIEVLCKVMTA